MEEEVVVLGSGSMQALAEHIAGLELEQELAECVAVALVDDCEHEELAVVEYCSAVVELHLASPLAEEGVHAPSLELVGCVAVASHVDEHYELAGVGCVPVVVGQQLADEELHSP